MTVLIVAGSRSIDDRDEVRFAIQDADLLFGPVDTIIHGGADGVDSIAHVIATDMGYPVEVFEANWDEYGRAAGPIRNGQMAQAGDALVAVWDGESKGTKHMIDEALTRGLDVLVKQV